MIQLENLSKSYSTGQLFSNVNLVLKKGMRVGLVGQNGSGKTTLLRMILGKESPDDGNIKQQKNLTIGYLAQEIIIGTGGSILDEVLSSCPEAVEIETKISIISNKILKDPTNALLIEQLGDQQIKYDSVGGWDLEKKAKKILGGLGFKKESLSDKIDSLSGGWRMRVALASILLKEPDILLLDEPTNHLDLDSTIWLENFLTNWKGSMVIISHDRTFLDRSINNIFEISYKKITSYKGDYSNYTIEKKLRLEQQKKSYKNQQREIKETERFIERFRYKNTKASQVQSRIKMIEKMVKIEEPKENISEMNLKIPDSRRLPLKVVTFKNVDKAYNDIVVFKNLNLVLERNNKIGLVGYNGAGKTTFLKLIAGVQSPSDGEIVYGNNVEVAYYAQHQLDLLNENDTLIESLGRVSDGLSELDKRTFLGGFLFSNNDIDKKVKVLSGGEKARLALGRILVGKPNLILLDEPTNHLDMVSRRVLENALMNYTGSLVCISHDRHFLNKVTNYTYEVGCKTIIKYNGNYDYYDWKKKEKIEPKNDLEYVTEVYKKGDKYKERKKNKNRLNAIEKQLKKIESELDELQSIVNNKKNISDHKLLGNTISEIKKFETKYLNLLEEKELLILK